ncbi:MAG: AI-2E family transporter [Polyangiaceae bacterium]|jgi:predicted PurR-regulated permease PerM|nr:AI-2E family transporter [Polyangiaceae bacterium]
MTSRPSDRAPPPDDVEPPGARRSVAPESEASPLGARRWIAPESEASPLFARRSLGPESEASFSRRPLGRVSVLDDGANELARRLASPSTSRQRRALAIFALTGAVGLVSVALPVGAGLLLGGFVGFSLQPIYERLRRHLRPGTAAFTCAAGSGATIAGSLAGLAFLFVDRGAELVERIPGLLARGGPVSRFVERAARQTAVVRLRPGEIDEKLNERVTELASGVPTVAAQVAGAALNTLLTLFFMTITTYFILRRWDRLVRRAELLLPLHPRHTRALFVQLRDVGRHVLVGTVLTGLAQGLLAALGYWATGAPQPAFFGALTAVASLVPAVGTLLVWAPLGAYLVWTGHPVAGACELAYGTLVVVGLSDYVLRPKLVGDEEAVPALLTFVALFGGVEVFGFLGLVLGPVIVTLAVALLRTYYEEVAVRHGGAEGGSPRPSLGP